MGLNSNINRVQLLGNTTAQPELKEVKDGIKVANFTVATNRNYQRNAEWKTEVEFHNIVAWNKLAEQASEKIQKGSKVFVEGRLQTQSWEDKETNKKMYKTVIIVYDLNILEAGQKQDTQESGGEVDVEDLPF